MEKQNFKRLMSCLWFLTNITFTFSQTKSEALDAYGCAKNVAPEKVWAGMGNFYYRESQFQTVVSEANQLFAIMSRELEKEEAEKQVLANRINELEREMVTLSQQRQAQNSQIRPINNNVRPPEEEKDDGDEDNDRLRVRNHKGKTTNMSEWLSDNILLLLVGTIVLYLLYQKLFKKT